MIKKHSHCRLKICETLGVNFAYLVVSYLLTHNHPM
jgi:hypothetical protein